MPHQTRENLDKPTPGNGAHTLRLWLVLVGVLWPALTLWSKLGRPKTS